MDIRTFNTCHYLIEIVSCLHTRNDELIGPCHLKQILNSVNCFHFDWNGDQGIETTSVRCCQYECRKKPENVPNVYRHSRHVKQIDLLSKKGIDTDPENLIAFRVTVGQMFAQLVK